MKVLYILISKFAKPILCSKYGNVIKQVALLKAGELPGIWTKTVFRSNTGFCIEWWSTGYWMVQYWPPDGSVLAYGWVNSGPEMLPKEFETMFLQLWTCVTMWLCMYDGQSDYFKVCTSKFKSLFTIRIGNFFDIGPISFTKC